MAMWAALISAIDILSIRSIGSGRVEGAGRRPPLQGLEGARRLLTRRIDGIALVDRSNGEPVVIRLRGVRGRDAARARLLEAGEVLFVPDLRDRGYARWLAGLSAR